MDSSFVAPLSNQNAIVDTNLKTEVLNSEHPLGEIHGPSDSALAGRVMMGNVIPGNPVSIHTVVKTIQAREKSFPVRMGKNGKLEVLDDEDGSLEDQAAELLGKEEGRN